MDLSYSFPATLLKSGEEKDGRIPITIIPNHPSIDRQKDKIILKAFDQDCIDGFLFDGVIDYDHQSLLAKSAIERAKAIIGEPERFYIDEKRSVPVCDGFLFKGNPYVDDVIMPALKAESKVFGASLGGRILQKSTETDVKTKSNTNVISKISLKHIAITPLQKAVHQKTTVMLRKSTCAHDGSCGNGSCSGKCEDKYELNFDSFDTFVKSFDDDELIQKALEAGAQTDSAKITGGQALQEQSLEGAKKKKKKVNNDKIKKCMPNIIGDLLKGNIGPTFHHYERYLKSHYDFNDEEIVDIVTLLAMNGAKIVKLVK